MCGADAKAESWKKEAFDHTHIAPTQTKKRKTHKMAMAFVYQDLKAHYFDPLAKAAVPELDANIEIQILLLTLPYLYYTYLWHFQVHGAKFPNPWNASFSLRMSHVSHAMKLVQFFVLIKYCGAAFPHYFKPVNAVLPEAYKVQTYDFPSRTGFQLLTCCCSLLDKH